MRDAQLGGGPAAEGQHQHLLGVGAGRRSARPPPRRASWSCRCRPGEHQQRAAGVVDDLLLRRVERRDAHGPGSRPDQPVRRRRAGARLCSRPSSHHDPWTRPAGPVRDLCLWSPRPREPDRVAAAPLEGEIHVHRTATRHRPERAGPLRPGRRTDPDRAGQPRRHRPHAGRVRPRGAGALPPRTGSDHDHPRHGGTATPSAGPPTDAMWTSRLRHRIFDGCPPRRCCPTSSRPTSPAGSTSSACSPSPRSASIIASGLRARLRGPAVVARIERRALRQQPALLVGADLLLRDGRPPVGQVLDGRLAGQAAR